MKNIKRKIYHSIRPYLIKIGSNNPFMRLIALHLLKPQCKELGTNIAFNKSSFEIRKNKEILKLAPNHWIYALTLSKDFDIYYNSVEAKKEGNYFSVDYSKPQVHKFKKSGLHFKISSFPEEEETIEDYFKLYRPKEGDTAFDLGANCGVSVYYLSKLVGSTGKVYAFEPDQINFGILTENIKLHDLKNVIAINKAIATVTGKMEFFNEGTIGSVLANQSSRATTGKIEIVETLSLEQACLDYGTPKFIKMDIEGAEIDVLESAVNFIKNNNFNFAIDTNHWRNGELTNAAVEEIFRKCSYEATSDNKSGFMTTWAGKKI